MIIKKADGSLVKVEKFNPNHCPKTGKFTSKGGKGAAGGGSSRPKTAEEKVKQQIKNHEKELQEELKANGYTKHAIFLQTTIDREKEALASGSGRRISSVILREPDLIDEDLD